MNDGYFLAHNSEITAPIRFKFWYELVEMTDINKIIISFFVKQSTYTVGFLRLGHI